ncbi:GW dipeptide domain-containing protein [Carnobacterium alterfunditum]|uniref:GW dipeptide domain-containing protein n=1 Tax=Carnobacterium alterfunditum TaxID=28230 RepID=UPI003593FA2E
MKNNNRKKLFITLSSGILLSLVTNQNVTYAAEPEQSEIGSNIELIDNTIIIEDITVYSLEGEDKVETQDLIEQITITQIDEETYKVSGITLENSEVILVIDDTEKFIDISDEKGNFEIEVKNISKASSIQALIKDNQENTYTVEFALADYIQQLEVTDQTQNDNLSETEVPAKVEAPAVEAPAVEAPAVEAPAVEAPAVEAPAVEAPAVEVPAVEVPAVEVPAVKEPAVKEPAVEAPAVEAPAVEEPAVEAPAVEEPVVEAPVVKEPIEVPITNTRMMQTFSMAMTTSTRTAVNGVYTVKSGDFAGAIANSFGISLTQLLAWNPQIKDANLISVGQEMNVTQAAYEKYLEDNKGNNLAQPRPFNTNKEFIDFITPLAMKIANAYGEEKLYSSVMIAQASLESAFGQSLLASPPYYNLFGIKGSYNGQTIPMGTWEDVTGGIINITANFRDYPSYYESMMDYADLLRTGLTGSPNFYSETWVKNTNSYKDATEYLTGTYATDKQYNIKLNSIIEQYNLTQYDTYIVDANITNTVNVSYNALISLSGYTIDTKPWGTSGYQMVDKTNTYLGSDVQAIKETTDGKYALITYNGNVLGWVDKTALEMSTKIGDVSSSVAVNYKAKVSRAGYSIDTLPWGTSGYKTLTSSTNYVGQEIEVVKEAKNGSYSLIALNGELLGWIDSSALSTYDVDINIPASHDISYAAIINETGYSIDTKPWGTVGYHTLNQTADYLGRTIQVVKETDNNQYVLISHDGKLLGWVDKKALKTYEVVTNVASSTPVNYKAVIDKASYSIDTMPWGTVGYQTIAKTTDYVGTEVDVIRKSGSYVLISVNGKVLGWVDKSALKTYTVETTISGATSISYTGIVSKAAYSIDTKPWGTAGYQTIGKTTDYVGTPVKVVKGMGAYVLIEANGQPIGWVDRKAVQMYTVDTAISSSKIVSYNAVIAKSAYSVDTKPWGTTGYQTVTKTNNFVGSSVKVIRETTNGNYALISLNGVTLGWVDKKALNN